MSFENGLTLRPYAAECMGVAMIVYFGIGAAIVPGSSQLQTALAFGIVYAFALYLRDDFSGFMNPVITLALCMTGDMSKKTAIAFVACQFAGGFLGAGLLAMTIPITQRESKYIGSNIKGVDFNGFNAFFGEFIGTFMLMYVIFYTVVHSKYKQGRFDAVVVGMAVFLIHCVLIPITGCSINPARSLGPAVIAAVTGESIDPLSQIWIFLIAPTLGAFVSIILWRYMWSTDHKNPDYTTEVSLTSDANHPDRAGRQFRIRPNLL
jgi:aquaporin Z